MPDAMPRPPSDNVFQVAFKIPKQWTADADEVAAALSRPGFEVTRTDVMRMAMASGLADLVAEARRKPKTKR